MSKNIWAGEEQYYTFSAKSIENAQTCAQCKCTSHEAEYMKCQDPKTKEFFWICRKRLFGGPICNAENKFKKG